MPKIVVAVIVILIIAYVVSYPSQSAHFVHEGWGNTKSIAHGLGHFVNKL